jgi:hypothetical protein
VFARNVSYVGVLLISVIDLTAEKPAYEPLRTQVPLTIFQRYSTPFSRIA